MGLSPEVIYRTLAPCPAAGRMRALLEQQVRMRRQRQHEAVLGAVALLAWCGLVAWLVIGWVVT